MLFPLPSPFAKTDTVCFSFDPMELTVTDYFQLVILNLPTFLVMWPMTWGRSVIADSCPSEQRPDTAGEVGWDHTEVPIFPAQPLGPGEGWWEITMWGGRVFQKMCVKIFMRQLTTLKSLIFSMEHMFQVILNVEIRDYIQQCGPCVTWTLFLWYFHISLCYWK